MRSRRRVRESGFKQRTLLEMYLQLFISDCRLLETSLGERRTALFSNAKRVGKTLRTLFSLMGIERSRYCFIKSFTYSMDYFCSVSGWGICARCFKNLTVRHLQLFQKKSKMPFGVGGGWGLVVLGTLELTEPFLFQAGTPQRDVSRKKKRGGGIGGESEFPPLRPLPLFLLFPRSLTSHRSPLSERVDRLEWAGSSYPIRNKTGKVL